MKNSFFYMGPRSYPIQKEEAFYEPSPGWSVWYSGTSPSNSDYNGQYNYGSYPQQWANAYYDDYYGNFYSRSSYPVTTGYTHNVPYNGNTTYPPTRFIQENKEPKKVLPYCVWKSHHTTTTPTTTHSTNTPVGPKTGAGIVYRPSRSEEEKFDAIESQFDKAYYATSARFAEIGFKIKLHTTKDYTSEEIEDISQHIEKAVKVFESNFGALKALKSSQEIDIFMFEHPTFFSNAAKLLTGSDGAVGMAWGGYNKIYVDMVTGGTNTFLHELGHILFFQATSGNFASHDGVRTNDGHSILNEGICEYLEHALRSHEDSSRSLANSARTLKWYMETHPGIKNARNLDEIMSAVYREEGKYTLHYQFSHLLVKYLQDNFPDMIKNALANAAAVDPWSRSDPADTLKHISAFPAGFFSWISSVAKGESIKPYAGVDSGTDVGGFVDKNSGNTEHESGKGENQGKHTNTVEPVKVGPIKVEPIKVEPIKVEPVKVEPVKVEPIKVKPVKVEPIKVEPIKVEPVKVEPVKVEPIKVEPVKVEPIKVEPVNIYVESIYAEPVYVSHIVSCYGNTRLPVKIGYTYLNDMYDYRSGYLNDMHGYRRSYVHADEKSLESEPSYDVSYQQSEASKASTDNEPSEESLHSLTHRHRDYSDAGVGEQHKHNSSAKGKFSDVEKNFGEVHVMHSDVLSKMNISIELHSVKPFTPKVIKHAEKIINATLGVFEKEFGELPQSSVPRKLDIYLFKHKEDLRNALEFIGEDKEAGGMAWTFYGKIYVAKLGKASFENLSHEVAHHLVDYATGRSREGVLDTTLMREGIAEYVQQVVRNGTGTTLDISNVADKVLQALDSNSSLKELKSLKEISKLIDDNPKDPNYYNLEYNMGSALVRHLQATNPGLLKEMFKAAAAGEHNADIAKRVDTVSDEFDTWLHDNSSSKFMEKHELLTVSPVHSIGYRDTIVNGVVTRVEAYTGRLEDRDGKEICDLNAVSHTTYMGKIRAYNPHTEDKVSVSNGYHNLKLIDTVDGKKYVYSDNTGAEYFKSNSDASVGSIAKIMSKYNGQFSVVFNAMQELDNAFSRYHSGSNAEQVRHLSDAIKSSVEALKNIAKDVNSPSIESLLNSDHRVFENSVEKTISSVYGIREAYSKYVTAKTQLLLDTKDNGSDSPQDVLPRVLKSLIFVSPESVIAREGYQFTDQPVGTILVIKGTGRADNSGLSVYRDNVKVGELSSNVEEFAKYVDPNGNTVTTFIVSDALKAIHTQYSGTPLIVVTKDGNGDIVANFLSGTKSGVLGDKEIEAEVNQFQDLHSKGLQSRESFPLSKGIKIATYNDNEHGIEKNQPFIEKGVITDDRGTDRESDDLYSATAKVDGKTLVEKMSSVQFYITEPRQDAAGNQTDGSDFVMFDIAADKTIQFPESITHLKLVKTDTGIVRLVPCTADGDTNPEGMPQNAEEYPYIDPIHAYKRLESKWVSDHDQFEMIDFNKYAKGTLFSIRFDADDHRIPKDANGEVVRVNDQSYISRVGIYAPNGEKIGELASAATFFQGSVFISLDQSYSQSDFVSSLHHQEAEVKDVGSGIKKVSLSGEGDLGTDQGYSEYHSFYQKEKQDDKQTVQQVIEAARSNNAGSVSKDIDEHSSHNGAVLIGAKGAHVIEDISDTFSEYNSHIQTHEQGGTNFHNRGEYGSTLHASYDSDSNSFLGM